MARSLARRGEAPRANPPRLAPPPGVGPGGAQLLPEARPPLPSSYPSGGGGGGRGRGREKNLGLLCNPPTRRCLEVLPVCAGHLCGMRSLDAGGTGSIFLEEQRQNNLTHSHTQAQTHPADLDMLRLMPNHSHRHRDTPAPAHSGDDSCLLVQHGGVAINKHRNPEVCRKKLHTSAPVEMWSVDHLDTCVHIQVPPSSGTHK